MTDRVINLYSHGASLKEISRTTGISHGKARKILITAGLYSSPRSEQIAELRGKGLNDAEIMEELHISSSTINAHTPYSKLPYNSDNPSANARRIKKCREQKINKSQQATERRKK